jgi:hypothetical protein
MSKNIPSSRDELSYELHRLFMEKAAKDWSNALKIARRNIISMRNSGSLPEKRLKRLESLLKEGPDVCAYVLLSHTKGSRELRECSVFCGILDEGR